MSLFKQVPIIDVRVDGLSGRPREIRAGSMRLPVTGLEAVRDETAAYPSGLGPRTVFIVRSHELRFRLTRLHRHRSWLVERLAHGSRPAGETLAA
jgi:hypothetical protein